MNSFFKKKEIISDLNQYRTKLYNRLELTIGRTQFREIDANLPNENRVFGKYEYQNPSGSHYDRVYIKLYRSFEEQKRIYPGATKIIENSSGAAGISCAFIGKQLGYDVIIILPNNLPRNRIERVRSFASEVILDDSGDYVLGTKRLLGRYLLNRDKKVFCLNHSRNSISLDAIGSCAYEMISSEIRLIDYFVGAAGNGTSLAGIGNVLKTQLKTKLVGVDPVEAPVLSILKGQTVLTAFRKHELYGLGAWGVEFPFLEEVDVDVVCTSSKDEWSSELRLLHQAGLNVGHSSAACLSVARKLSDTVEKQNFAIILYDTYLNY